MPYQAASFRSTRGARSGRRRLGPLCRRGRIAAAQREQWARAGETLREQNEVPDFIKDRPAPKQQRSPRPSR
jgi:hypothetical protein